MNDRPYPRVLSVAGSDPSGGAGIQADLKTFTVLKTYGMAAITALTAQNTLGVHGVHAVPAEFVRLQLDAVLSDIGVDAVKTGMLANPEIVEAVADQFGAHCVPNLVVDPVMVSKHGHPLLAPEAVETVKRQLLPLAAVVTPNAHEAALLAGCKVETLADMRAAAKAILAFGCRSVMVKGGHAANEAECVDYWTDGAEELVLPAPRLPAVHTHGTGCTLSAALAAHLAMGKTIPGSVRAAKEFITAAIAASFPLGGGIGPVNHLWMSE
jgi:hydroxymethylpyrimidine/phosphomethylpyrimidine kinase